MGEVIPFRPRRRAAQPITIEQIDIRDILNVTMGERRCTHCMGRGWIFTQDTYGLSVVPCPCGGTDEDRIETPDFDGAA